MSKKKRVRKKYNSRPTNKDRILGGFQTAMAQGRGAVRSAIQNARKVLPNDYKQIINSINKWPQEKHGISKKNYPTSYGSLQMFTHLPPLSLIKEVSWAIAFLNENIEELNSFLLLKQELSLEVLKGNNEKVESIFKAIEDQLGVSVWFIEARLAFLQGAYGLEAQKSYANEIKNNFPESLAGHLAHFISQRNEEQLSLLRFSKKYSEAVDTIDNNPTLQAYLRYKVTGSFPQDVELIAGLLSVDGANSTIDQYETLISIFQMMCLWENIFEKDALSELVSNSLDKLKGITDFRINKLFIISGKEQGLDKDALLKSNQNLESFLLGLDYNGALGCASSAILEEPDNISKYFSVARTFTSENIQADKSLPLQKVIINLMAKILAGGEGGQLAFEGLLKLSRNFKPFLFGDQVAAIVARDRSSLSLDPVVKFERLLFLSSPYLEPSGLLNLDVGIKEKYFSICEKYYKTSKALEYYKIASGLSDGEQTSLCDDSVTLALAVRSYNEKDLDNLSFLSGKLIKQEDSYVKWVARRFNIYCLIHNNFGELIDKVVLYSTEDASFAYTIPWGKVMLNRGWHDFKAYKNKITTSILVAIYLEFFEDNERESLLRNLWDAFLFENNLSKASEIRDKVSCFEKKQLIYFLKHICTQSVMDINNEFSSSRELDEERIKICLILMEIDTNNKTAYEEEIRETTRKLTVQDGVRLFDRSRIYVDEEGLKKWAKREVHTDFNRCLSLIDAGYASSTLKEVQDNLSPSEAENMTIVNDKLMEIPSKEADVLLRDILTTLSQEFLSSTEYGLDTFLSMRIRHGTISGHLRGPMENHKLITKKGGSGKYKVNEYWLNSIEVEVSKKDRLTSSLEKFSRKYDAIIEDLSRNRVHIRNPKKPNGFFFIDIQPLTVYGLLDRMTENPNFNEFLNDVFLLFWFALTPRLEEARGYLDIEVRGSMTDLIKDLQHDVEQILDSNQRIPICKEIGFASTEIQNAISRTCEWFHTNESDEISQRFTLDDVVEVALAEVKQVHNGFSPVVIQEVDSADMSGIQLRLVSDALFIIFDNIHNHSGCEKPKVEIKVQINVVDEVMVIYVKNEIGNHVYSKDHETALEARRNSLFTKDYLLNVQVEKGSGFSKLRNISGLNTPSALNFGFLNENSFFVETHITVGSLTIEGDKV